MDSGKEQPARSLRNRMPEMWVAGPGAVLEFTFKGTECMIYDLTGPDCGWVSVTLDGKEVARSERVTKDVWAHCYILRLLTVGTGLPDQAHTVRLEVLPEKCPNKLTYLKNSMKPEFQALTAESLAASPYNMFAILYAKSAEISMDMDDYGAILAQCYAISFALSFVLGWFADRFHPLRMSIAALVAYLATMLAGWFTVSSADSFRVILYLHTIISGCYFTLSASLGQRLFPHALFAQFNSAAAMSSAIATVLLSALLGKLLVLLGSDYRYLFLFGTVTTALGACCLWVVYRHFLRLGGDRAYQAPAPDRP